LQQSFHSNRKYYLTHQEGILDRHLWLLFRRRS